MDSEIKKLTRAELYVAVWKEPLTKLSAKYGISDRWIAKVCKRYKIPVPGIGYWAKIHAGHKVPRVSLPQLKLHNPAQIVFTCRPPKMIDDKYSKKVVDALLFEQDSRNKIVVISDDNLKHPITLKIQRRLSSRKDKMGVL